MGDPHNNNIAFSPTDTDKNEKYVEFFNPKIRRELEKKDEDYKKAHGYKGGAPGGDEWVWLTNYCRIPVSLCLCFVGPISRITHHHQMICIFNITAANHTKTASPHTFTCFA